MKVLRQVGDRIDEALIDLILAKAGAVHRTQTYTICLNELRLEVRDVKARLLDAGPAGTDLLLADDSSVNVTEAELQSHPKVMSFVRDLKKTMAQSLSRLGEESLRALNGRCRVVLTGGGARLPALRDACSVTLDVDGSGVSLSVVDANPEWLNARPQDFIDVFDQMAVVAGGCLDDDEAAWVAPAVKSYGAGAPRRIIEQTYKS